MGSEREVRGARYADSYDPTEPRLLVSPRFFSQIISLPLATRAQSAKFGRSRAERGDNVNVSYSHSLAFIP